MSGISGAEDCSGDYVHMYVDSVRDHNANQDIDKIRKREEDEDTIRAVRGCRIWHTRARP